MEWPSSCPVRACLVNADRRLKMLHKPGMVFHLTPETIDFCGGFVDRDRGFERDTTLGILARGVDVHALIGWAMAGEATVHQDTTAKHKQQAGQRATQAVECQCPTAKHRERPFDAPDIDLRVSELVVCSDPRLGRIHARMRRPGNGCYVF